MGNDNDVLVGVHFSAAEIERLKSMTLTKTNASAVYVAAMSYAREHEEEVTHA